MTVSPEPLNNRTVSSRAAYPERIVQFGAGNFLRGFVDWILQDLNETTDFDGGAVVVRVTPNGTYETLDAQDGLFHVILRGVQNGQPVSDVRRIDCLTRSVYPHVDFAPFLALAEQPEIRFLISNTTESGIVYDESDQATDEPPRSFPAKLTVFLHHRYQHYQGAADKGCIILPTELISDNGAQLKRFVLQYAEQWGLDAGFTAWINQHNVFCNTLVDRIVTGFLPDEAADLQAQIGYQDDLFVTGEPYHSWIIEGPDSVAEELHLADSTLNIKVVPDAEPSRETKVRILNGLHTTMAMTGPLLGLETVRGAIEHTAFRQMLMDMLYQEIIPAMDLPQDELSAFAEDVFDRFANPHIQHKLLNIALNTSSKARTRLLPSILDYQAKFDRLPPRLMLAFASFVRFYQGEWQGQTLPLQDDDAVIAQFRQWWAEADSPHTLASMVLAQTSLWGRDLTQIPGFVDTLAQMLEQIEGGDVLSAPGSG